MWRACLAFVLVTATAMAGDQPDNIKMKKPRLDLRATPRMAFSPVTIFLTAELTGGGDADEFYCPEVVWDWADGGRSVRESDCTPQEDGGQMPRRFTAEHAYLRAGIYNVKVTLLRNERPVATRSATVTVHAGGGDMSGGMD